jgi:hypothetical protein
MIALAKKVVIVRIVLEKNGVIDKTVFAHK